MRDPATRAFLLAASAGMSLRQALLIAARAAPVGAEPYASAARSLEGDSFRSELIAKLPIRPEHVRELLVKSPAADLPRLAKAMLDAERGPPPEGTTRGLALFALAVIEAGIAILFAYVRPLIAPGPDLLLVVGIALALALGLAA